MTEPEKQTIRQKAIDNGRSIEDGLAPLYLGRLCPLKHGADRECDGPRCQLGAPLNDDPEKPNAVTGFACSITLGAARVTELVSVVEELSHALKNLAAASSAPHILKT